MTSIQTYILIVFERFWMASNHKILLDYAVFWEKKGINN